MSCIFSREFGVKMRVLLMFLLSVLGCSLTTQTKCELKEALMMVFESLPEEVQEKGLTLNLAAKIVCHAELASGFNMSAVNELVHGMGDLSRRKRNAGSGLFGLAEFESLSSTNQPRTRARRHANPPPQDEEVWTLYGLFQLSNHLVCSDGMTPSPNICGMDCNKLVDEDITDDIGCLLKIVTNVLENGFMAAHEMIRMIRLVFQEECRNKNASEYFEECG